MYSGRSISPITRLSKMRCEEMKIIPPLRNKRSSKDHLMIRFETKTWLMENQVKLSCFRKCSSGDTTAVILIKTSPEVSTITLKELNWIKRRQKTCHEFHVTKLTDDSEVQSFTDRALDVRVVVSAGLADESAVMLFAGNQRKSGRFSRQRGVLPNDLTRVCLDIQLVLDRQRRRFLPNLTVEDHNWVF